MNKSLTIRGSHGAFKVDAETGAVITPVGQMPHEYARICRVNLAEYRRWCESEGLAPTTRTIDIPLLGVVSMNDQGQELLEDPEWDARADLLTELAA